ncbi:hypothetical protein BLNAU_11166 [Blattamonas nauphoetae]|uniref:Uncharacterized protein n=1 Tax=Blattamonas nauphoetae TaxID=2049346 RepID=A0ABQ9XSP3_9EUKA|nr:hypothetical protein BLNAU_11166 [Blattamonas nauphoetae]
MEFSLHLHSLRKAVSATSYNVFFYESTMLEKHGSAGFFSITLRRLKGQFFRHFTTSRPLASDWHRRHRWQRRMTGKELVTGETNDVSLSVGSSVKHIVSMMFSVFDDAWMRSALLYPWSDDELDHGVEYNATEFSQTVSSTTATHFFEANLVKIMAESPRLTTPNPFVDYSDQNKKGVVSLSGIGLSEEYTVTMTRSKGLSGTETMSVSFDSFGNGRINGVLYGTAGVGELGLKYVMIYEVSGMMNSSSKPVHFESDLVFETIAELSRLTKVNQPTTGFVGRHMVTGEYSVSLENMADDDIIDGNELETILRGCSMILGIWSADIGFGVEQSCSWIFGFISTETERAVHDPVGEQENGEESILINEVMTPKTHSS